jgi:hypothetical protein
MSDGCGRLAFRAFEENAPRPGGRFWRAGRVAVYMPSRGRGRLADHDWDRALQGLAAVRGALHAGKPANAMAQTGAKIPDRAPSLKRLVEILEQEQRGNATFFNAQRCSR